MDASEVKKLLTLLFGYNPARYETGLPFLKTINSSILIRFLSEEFPNFDSMENLMKLVMSQPFWYNGELKNKFIRTKNYTTTKKNVYCETLVINNPDNNQEYDGFSYNMILSPGRDLYEAANNIQPHSQSHTDVYVYSSSLVEGKDIAVEGNNYRLDPNGIYSVLITKVYPTLLYLYESECSGWYCDTVSTLGLLLDIYGITEDDNIPVSRYNNESDYVLQMPNVELKNPIIPMFWPDSIANIVEGLAGLYRDTKNDKVYCYGKGDDLITEQIRDVYGKIDPDNPTHDVNLSMSHMLYEEPHYEPASSFSQKLDELVNYKELLSDPQVLYDRVSRYFS